jgi:hypothetical protein
MAKEEKPLEYQRRIRDTKCVAQRLDLHYLRRPALLALLRRRLTWLLLVICAAAAVPLATGVGGGRRALMNGPVSSAHAVFAERCADCHVSSFGGVPDRACQSCHDGPPHPAKIIDTARLKAAPRCADCHMEHKGNAALSVVASGNCTECHADLTAHGSGVKLQGVRITGFGAGKHPDFSTASMVDSRPLKLNHAVHMPASPKVIRGIRLPMKCTDCHATDRNSPAGELLPVTFEQNCESCHARELEFDVDHVLGPSAPPAPHTRDPKTIRDFVWNAYRAALAADPSLFRRPLGNDLAPQPGAAAWLDRAVSDSLTYLFDRKCAYCHTTGPQPWTARDPIVQPVARIHGRYPSGNPWLERADFGHRSHRAVACESCHNTARASTKTADVLIPHMERCETCHAGSAAGLDRCSECHRYHNRSLERDNDRRTGGTL